MLILIRLTRQTKCYLFIYNGDDRHNYPQFFHLFYWGSNIQSHNNKTKFLFNTQQLIIYIFLNQAMQNVNPFELFKEEMDTDDVASKINNIHKIPIVIALMTPDAIKNTLLPYLQNLVKKEDDQVVYAITQQLANVGPALGANHTSILPLLQSLCGHDQTVVRDRAVKSITKLFQKYTDNQINNVLLPLIIRLASNELNFTCRVSATHLICSIYPRAGQNKEKLRLKFTDISNEEMLLLQRVTATKISHMCKVYEKQFIITDLINILKHRSSDQQDQIRVLAVDSFKEVSKFLTKQQNKTYILPLIIQAAEDKSWRVRLCLSKNFSDIAKSFGKQVADNSLIQTYSHLLKDPEVDVKIEAVKSFSTFVQIISPEKLSTLVTQVIALGKDNLSIVRANSCHVVKSMLPYISKDQAYQNIQPLIKQLMKDESQEVRKGGIDAASKFVEVLGPESIGALYQSFKICSQDLKWRVRLELMSSLTKLAVALKNFEFFSKYIEPLFLNYLNDRAAGVRVVGVAAIANFVKVFGDQWTNNFIIKLEEILNKETSYHFKIASIYSLKEISLSQSGDKYVEKCVSCIIKVCSSQVPNIREVSIKSLRDISLRFDKDSIREAIKKQIVALSNDSDFEVKTTASQVLNRI